MNIATINPDNSFREEIAIRFYNLICQSIQFTVTMFSETNSANVCQTRVICLATGSAHRTELKALYHAPVDGDFHEALGKKCTWLQHARLICSICTICCTESAPRQTATRLGHCARFGIRPRTTAFNTGGFNQLSCPPRKRGGSRAWDLRAGAALSGDRKRNDVSGYNWEIDGNTVFLSNFPFECTPTGASSKQRASARKSGGNV